MKLFTPPLYATLFFGLLLISCSSTGILQVKPGVYMVSATGTSPAFTGTEDAIKTAYAEAAAYCAAQNRDIDTQSLERVEQALGRPGRATLHFRCVEKPRS